MFKKYGIVIFLTLMAPGLVLGVANDGDHVFFYDQWGSPGFETINDWVKVGSAGYSTYFSLNSDVDCTEDALSAESLKTKLDWSVPTTQVVPAGTWCGYEFTIDNSIKEDIIQWYTAGRYNIGASAEVRLVNLDGDILWIYNDIGTWVSETSSVFLPTQTVRLIIYQKTSATLWAGQYFYARLMKMYTQDIPRFFGYYFTNSASFDGYDSVDEFTNLNHVMITSLSQAEVNSLGQDYADNGCKMLIDTRWQFFDGNNDLLPLATRQANWDALWNKIQPIMSVVGGMYLIDEPVSRGVSYSDLTTVISEIKDDYSGPLMAVYAYPTIENLTWGVIPTNIDWVGVDKYSCSFSDIEDLVDNLEAFLASWQYIFLVPQATTFTSCSVVANPVLEVADWQVHNWSYDYYELANNDPRIIGMLCFLAEDLLNCTMPLTLDAQDIIGSRIK